MPNDAALASTTSNVSLPSLVIGLSSASAGSENISSWKLPPIVMVPAASLPVTLSTFSPPPMADRRPPRPPEPGSDVFGSVVVAGSWVCWLSSMIRLKGT